MFAGVASRPRPVPRKLLPLLASGGVVLLALPIFLVLGWTTKGWALGAVLWAASQGLALLLSRLSLGADKLASSGVVAFGMMFRSIAVMLVIIAVAVTHKWVGIAAAGVYALAYTMELGTAMLSYFSGPVTAVAKEPHEQ